MPRSTPVSGGFNGGERELAVQMAGSAAGMLVIMDRGFPAVELWKAFTSAGAHLLLRARSAVASRPVEVLQDGSYLGRMSLAGQRAPPPGVSRTRYSFAISSPTSRHVHNCPESPTSQGR